MHGSYTTLKNHKHTEAVTIKPSLKVLTILCTGEQT